MDAATAWRDACVATTSSDHHDPDATRPHDPGNDEPPRLVVLGDDGATSYPLPSAGTVRIGRGEDVDVRIDRESVSRRHAALHLGPPMTIEDIGSSNGTRVAGIKLAPHVPTAILSGDVIELGRVTLLVQGGPSPSSRGVPVRLAGRAAPASPELVPRIAASDIHVLILGETGVGKEVMARTIHAASTRAAGPFVAINCGAVPESLIESELFGYEAGAFTGAAKAKPGLLETGAGGTIFLDEVGELPALAQVKLLRVLEDRRVQRVGGVSARELDARFVAATHRDLRADVASGRFRQDLYYRLNGITLSLGPLRERIAELPALVEQFVALAAGRLGRPVPSVAPASLAILRGHTWPGNIRELRNVIERAVVLCDGSVLLPEHIVMEDVSPIATAPAVTAAAPSTELATGEPDERARIVAALTQCAGNQTRAAELLGMARKTLGIKMDALGIPRPQKSRP
ncbi:MAG: sigma 54-interacting transcriptional regulator [Myxococcales bacterium]|nr:sigma 54-interacting transcriptional regulator [Myxococcales bacterium]